MRKAVLQYVEMSAVRNSIEDHRLMVLPKEKTPGVKSVVICRIEGARRKGQLHWIGALE